jgi:hypothetical protein
MKLENILTKWKLKLLKDSAYSTWHEYVAHNSLDELLYKFYSLGKLHAQQDYKRKKDEIPSKLKYTPGMVINGYKFLQDSINKSWVGETGFVWGFVDLYYNLNYYQPPH